MVIYMFLAIFNFIKNLFFFTGSYSNTIFPEPLSKIEEEKAILEMEKGNKEARNKLILHNLRLVAHIVKKFETDSNMADDLISIGTIGLIKGIDSYNSSKKIKITTYVAKCIENEILMYFRANKKFNGDISLNETIGLDRDGDEISLLDVLPSNEEDLPTQIFKQMNIEALNRYLGILNERERSIIIKRYGLFKEEELTQKDIAKSLGISRSYVSRIEKRALTKLLKEFYKSSHGEI